MKKIDMHIHTNASDGVYTSAEAVRIAKEKGIEIFAISDHDSIANVAESVALAKQADIICVPAMEATTSFNGLEIHVLGYGLDRTHPLLQKYLDETYQIRRNKEINIIKKAKELFGGDDINLEDFEKFAETKQRGGFLSYNYLRKKGKIKDLDGFFNLKKELDLQQCPFQNTKVVMKMFHIIGAVTVLAHPSYHFTGDVMPREMLDQFTALGIDGVECYSPYNDKEEQIQYYKNYCKQNNLAISGGSDCHGPYLTREMGVPHVTTDNTTIIQKLQAEGLLILETNGVL